MLVLIVGSDAPLASRMAWILSAEGLHVETVSTPDESIVRLRSISPDVVLFDTHLPPAEKRVWLAAMRQQSDAAIVDLLDVHDRPRAALASCADSVLSKPFDADTLIDIVRRSGMANRPYA